MFTVSKKSLIAYHVLAHTAFLYMLFTASAVHWAIAIALYFFMVTVGGTVTYHRLLSHRSFDSPKWFEYLGSIVGALGGNGSGLAWVAIHREHHRYTDKEKDPHSPLFKSFFKIQFLSMLDTPNMRYVPDLLRSKFHTWVHINYWLINFIYVIILCCIDPYAVIYAYFIPTLLVWHGGSAINTVNHLIGYRSHDSADHSTNNFVTGYLVSGEGWHNNHHAFPNDPEFGKKWYEFDLGYKLINLIKK